MKKFLLYIVGLILIAYILMEFTVIVVPVKEQTPYSFEIISSPPGAKIEINGKYVGTAPVYVEFRNNIFFNDSGVIPLIDTVNVVAYPTDAGQYIQKKRLSTIFHKLRFLREKYSLI